MIDMHSHILPGLDDGAASLEEAVEMARIACANGITAMAATPHGPGNNLAESLLRRDAALAELRQALERENIPLRLIPGMEFMVMDNVMELACEYPGVFYGGAEQPSRMLLLELFPGYDLRFCKDLLFQAQLKNIQLVLAHPERYHGFLQNIDLFEELLDKGLILQFNTAALNKSWFNLRRKNAVKRLIRHKPSRIIFGSDAHDTKHRPPVMDKGQGPTGQCNPGWQFFLTTKDTNGHEKNCL
ncbi:MAG: hypothetical protein GX927_04345 [Lentisphaerae bacterium]|jgi:protein-tyrosine phosphatase|nr:hypothetical protein [Lentisphaerota bacterium]